MANIQNELNNIKNAVYGKDVRNSIHDAIEQCYTDASINGNANMEVTQARGEHKTLRERLDDHASQLAQKVNLNDTYLKNDVYNKSQVDNKVFSMANMGQDIKEAMTGGSVAVVGKNAILAENIVNGQVNNNKLDLPVKDLLPLTYIFSLMAVNNSTGELEPNSQNARATTNDIITFEAGTTLYLRDKVNTHYALAYYNQDGTFNRYVTFTTNDKTFTETSYVRIMQKYSDSYNHTINDLEYFANNMYSINKNTVISEERIDEKISNASDMLKTNIVDTNDVLSNILYSTLNNSNVLRDNNETRTVEAGSYYAIDISLNERRAGTYYGFVYTDNMEGEYHKEIAISAYSTSMGVKYGETIYVGNGLYLCQFVLNDVNDISSYDQFRLLISMRSSNKPMTLYSYKLYHVSSDSINTNLANIVETMIKGYNSVLKNETEFEIPATDFHKTIISYPTLSHYAIISTNDTSNAHGPNINLSIYNSSQGSTKGLTVYLGSGKYLCAFDKDLAKEYIKGDCEFRLLIDLRTYDKPLIIYDYEIFNNSITVSDLTLYVSPTGSDSNNGLSSSNPLKTFQKAIDLGATKILASPGIYWGQTIYATNMDELEIKVVSGKIDYTNGQKAKAILHNGNSIEMSFDNSLNLYVGEKTFDITHNYHKVFITNELDIEATWRQSTSYNAILWEINSSDFTKDKKLVPVLTLSECQSVVGSFYYDGVKIYVNPNDKNNNLFRYPMVYDNSVNGIKIENVRRLCLEDIEVAFASKEGFQLTSINEATITSCISHHTSYGSCFNIDNVNGNFYNCTGYKSRVDGFGIVGGGNTNFYDCFGYYNYDDGISHHDYCTGIIDGGEWHHNLKGGVSPAHGAQVDVKNIFSHHNGYGIYSVSSDDRPKGFTVRHINNVCYNNKYGIGVANYHVISYNCKYDNNTIPIYVSKENEYTSHTEL